MIQYIINIILGIINDECNKILKQPIEKILDERRLHQELNNAVKRAEERFGQDYQMIDIELTNVLVRQTRFADIPSVQNALREIFTNPFYNQSPSHRGSQTLLQRCASEPL